MLTCGSYALLVRLFSSAPCVNLRVTQLAIAYVTGHFALRPAPRPGAPWSDPTALRMFAETSTKGAVLDPSASFVTFAADVAVPTPPTAVPYHTNSRLSRLIAELFVLELLHHPDTDCLFTIRRLTFRCTCWVLVSRIQYACPNFKSLFDRLLSEECKAGFFFGPSFLPPLKNFVCSSL